LLDIRMPKMDGVELLRRIKAEPALHAMPVIMLTTTNDPREVKECYELGCNSYVTKPVNYQQFAEALTRLGLFILIMQVAPVNGH
jgi:CheY-like chemotaxis protein